MAAGVSLWCVFPCSKNTSNLFTFAYTLYLFELTIYTTEILSKKYTYIQMIKNPIWFLCWHFVLCVFRLRIHITTHLCWSRAGCTASPWEPPRSPPSAPSGRKKTPKGKNNAFTVAYWYQITKTVDFDLFYWYRTVYSLTVDGVASQSFTHLSNFINA